MITVVFSRADSTATTVTVRRDGGGVWLTAEGLQLTMRLDEPAAARLRDDLVALTLADPYPYPEEQHP